MRAVLDFWRPKAGENGSRPRRARSRPRSPATAAAEAARRRGDRATVEAFLLDRLRVRAGGARASPADEVGRGRSRRAASAGRRSPTRSTPGAASRRCSACAREVPGGLRRPGRGLQARQEHPRAGRRRPPRSTRRSSRTTPSARSTRPPRGLEQADGLATRTACAASPLCAPRWRASSTTCSSWPRTRACAPTGSPSSSRLSRSSTASRTFPVSEVHRDSIRLLLRRRQGGRQQGHEGHARRQGRRPRRDDQRRRAGARPASRSRPQACNAYYEQRRQAARPRWTSRWTPALAKLEALQGKKLGDAADPLLVSVRSGSKFSMPGMMDTILNLGMNDQLGRRARRPRPATPASPRTATAASSRCTATSCSASTRTSSSTSSSRGQEEVQGEDRRRARREGPRRGDRALQGGGAEGDAQALPAGPARAARRAPATPSSSRG